MYKRLSLTAFAALISWTGAAAAQEVAGEAVRVQSGSVQRIAVSADTLTRGDQVFQQARLITDDTGSAEVEMIDGTKVTLAESSDLLVDEFVYNPNGRQSLVLRLGVGAMRMVSGRITKEAVRVETPVAVLGIRGTDFTLDTRLQNLLRMWLEEGAITITARDSGLVFEFDAPARADCTPIACRVLAFTAAPRAFQFGGGQDGQDDDNFDRGGEGSGAGGNSRN